MNAVRSQRATAAGAQAFQRLLDLAEASCAGQTVRIVRFVAAMYDGEVYPLDPFDLRAVDTPISDDMLLCLDALRWGIVDLHKQVPNGETRVLAILANNGIAPLDL